MAILNPFCGFRPRIDFAEKVASRPYDVLNTTEARAEAVDNDFSFLHVVKSEIDLPEGTDPYDDLVYSTARANLDRLIELGRLVQDDRPCFYLYRQEMDGRGQTGVVGCTSVVDYEKNVIKKHEHTREVKERDRIRHVDECNANTGPVFLSYRSTDKVDAIVESWCESHKAIYNFEADQVRHIFWVVDEEKVIRELRNAFSRIDTLYVADGHHRSASAAKVAARRRNTNQKHTGKEEYNYFMSVVFPDQQLKIIDYNRVIRDLADRSPEQFLEALTTEGFTLEQKSLTGEPWRPEQRGDFGVYLDGNWYALKAAEAWAQAEDAVERLDVAILQQHVLTNLLGITDPRKDERIDFVGGIRGLGELETRVDSGEMAVAFALYPTSMEDLMSVADSGRVMPPKSTWFEPKLRSGLIVHRLD